MPMSPGLRSTTRVPSARFVRRLLAATTGSSWAVRRRVRTQRSSSRSSRLADVSERPLCSTSRGCLPRSPRTPIAQRAHATQVARSREPVGVLQGAASSSEKRGRADAAQRDGDSRNRSSSPITTLGEHHRRYVNGTSAIVVDRAVRGHLEGRENRTVNTWTR